MKGEVKELSDRINNHSPNFQATYRLNPSIKRGTIEHLQQEHNTPSIYTQTEYIQITHWRRPG